MINAINLTIKEFDLISKLVYDRFGITLSENKRTLVVERLQKLVRQGGFESFEEYYDYVVADCSGKELLTLIDKISTNHTFFFREQEHFNFLKNEALPRLMEEKRRQGCSEFRFWSAGCSSGEEAYTLAITLSEYFGAELKKWKIGILATDIATSVLEKGAAGIYNDTQLANTPPELKRKYFQAVGPCQWEVTSEIKKMVMFRRLNLMNSCFPFNNNFDIIFCRNVMIYFDETTRNNLIEKYHRHIVPSGYLFIGHSETLSRQNDLFRYIKPATYQKTS